MDLELEGKRALITGGSKGIGLACAHALAAEGANLAIAAREIAPLKAATRILRSDYGIEVTSHSCDLARPEHQAALAEVVGDVDILINNAGAVPAGDLASTDEETWRQAWDLKVFGSINLVRMVLPAMRRRGSGVVVNVIGSAHAFPRADYLAGGSANGALANFTCALGADTFPDGVRVVGVSPGLTETARMESLLRQQAADRFGDPDRWHDLLLSGPPPAQAEEIADVVVFVASERASYLSGTIVTVDGGAGFR